MQAETQIQIKESIEQYLADKQLSQNKLAAEIGINPATLSVMRKGGKPGHNVSDEMWRKVDAHVNPTGSSVRAINTRNLKAITDLCDDARHNTRMLGISDFTGAGKTFALERVSRQPNTYYVLTTCLMTQKSFLMKVARSMGLRIHGTKEQVLEAIVEQLNADNAPLLILDDFGKVRDNVYRMLQLIYDSTQGRCGIVVAGVENLKRYIHRCRDRSKMGFAEMSRRIEYWLPLHRPSRKEVTMIARLHGIEDKRAHDYLNNRTKDFGTLNALITNARRAVGEQPITVEALIHTKVD